MNGILREVRLLTAQALSGTSGTPGVSSSLVTAATKRMANAGRTTGSAPVERWEVGCSNHSLALWSGVAQSPSCRPLSPDRMNRANACGNTLVSGGSNPPVGRLIDRFLASTCRAPERKRMNGECRHDYRDRASVTKVAEGRMFKPSLSSFRMESSSVIVLPTLVARSNEKDECLRDYR